MMCCKASGVNMPRKARGRELKEVKKKPTAWVGQIYFPDGDRGDNRIMSEDWRIVQFCILIPDIDSGNDARAGIEKFRRFVETK